MVSFLASSARNWKFSSLSEARSKPFWRRPIGASGLAGDYVPLLTAVQTGLRLSELVGLDRGAITLGSSGQIRRYGKGREERVTPITKLLNSALRAWMDEPQKVIEPSAVRFV